MDRGMLGERVGIEEDFYYICIAYKGRDLRYLFDFQLLKIRGFYYFLPYWGGFPRGDKPNWV